jgi:type II secretion system protein N
MTIGEMSTMFPNGIEATGVRLVKEGKKEKLPLAINLSELSARISLLGLITGKKDVSFSSQLLKGKVEGAFMLDGGKWSLRAKVAGVDLGKLNFWKDIIGQELAGKLSGDVKLAVDPKDVKASSGTINLDIVQGKVGQGKAYGVTLPWIALGKAQASLEIKKGKANIKACKVSSDDIEANLDGYLLLQQKIEDISAHCRLRFKPSDEKLAEIRKQIPEELRSFLDNGLNRAKGKDGYFRYSIFGRIYGGKPQFRPLKQ